MGRNTGRDYETAESEGGTQAKIELTISLGVDDNLLWVWFLQPSGDLARLSPGPNLQGGP